MPYMHDNLDGVIHVPDTEPHPHAFWRGVGCGLVLSLPLWALLFYGIVRVGNMLLAWWSTTP